ncbi:tubulin-tyrosine ligase family-domain-containing protein [Jimgerdemannia flammicorona]|uniref:Tubulin-tyrosine ligase family-domain-containing protein n=1 Tax=Jimgerdemannia flammicorona TaxID=994334 RepID=A0A433CWN8_9FUNG|nr:tubulin-tyrosine ligase family-domain-containing protein [Jimgerdemannia flammicorona]
MSPTFDIFVEVHKYQLVSIPETLWEPLFMKLSNDLLDAGNVFELHYGEPLSGDIFLIDHAWTTKPELARTELASVPGLLDRLENLMDITEAEVEEEEGEEAVEEDDPNVDMVAQQAKVGRKEARQALMTENHDIINAIMRLTMSEEQKGDAERLHDQVMGQLEASGQAEAKAEKEAKEKEEAKKKARINRAFDTMWKFNQTYQFSVLGQEGEAQMESVGSAIVHSSSPNVSCVPFIFSRGGAETLPYSVVFPVREIAHGDLVTRDFVPVALTQQLERKAYLSAFEGRIANEAEEASEADVATFAEEYKVCHRDMFHDHISIFERSCPALYYHRIRYYNIRHSSITNERFVVCIKTFISTPSHSPSTISQKSQLSPIALLKSPVTQRATLKVYTTADFVRNNLSLPHIAFTENQKETDLLWLSQDFYEFDGLCSGQRINQFVNESCLTYKHNFSDLVRQTYGQVPWHPTTYNVVSNLPALIGNFYQNEEKQNLWIVKPCINISITHTLAQLIRQRDYPNPRIAQRYIVNPCLYQGRKFDLQYIVLLRCIEPTVVVCVYNMFWIRLTNKKFGLDDFEDHETHFTVMTQLHYKAFITNMENEYPNLHWGTVQTQIHKIFKEIFVAAAAQPQPLGLAKLAAASPPKHDSFAIYGIDVMLTEDFKPIVLGVNSSPDCTRACQVNKIFYELVVWFHPTQCYSTCVYGLWP